MADRARFIVDDLAATGLPDASVDAAIAIDTLAYAANKMAVLNEIRRIVSPRGRPVFTSWHPGIPGDQRLPYRHRDTNWPDLLSAAGCKEID